MIDRKTITLFFCKTLAMYCIPRVVNALFSSLSVVNFFEKKRIEQRNERKISLPCYFLIHLRYIVLRDH
jgi:hypothetical protein